jgi:HEPN domain-containing protein
MITVSHEIELAEGALRACARVRRNCEREGWQKGVYEAAVAVELNLAELLIALRRKQDELRSFPDAQ